MISPYFARVFFAVFLCQFGAAGSSKGVPKALGKRQRRRLHMRIQKAVVGAMAAAGLFVSSTIAFAGTVYMASSGHPWVGGSGNIGPAWSLFNVGDATVCANNSGSWVIPIAVPTSSSTVARTIKARFTTGADGEVWSFTATGAVHAGINVATNTNQVIDVPAGGTVFAKANLSSALAVQCMHNATFVQ
jgi:hypothetical protein